MKHETSNMLTDEWLTPMPILEPLGDFDTDPCVPMVMPWKTAKIMYNESHNGLLMPWEGRVWLNPPYGKNIDAWMNRMALQGNGIALVFARTETKWFFDSVWDHATGMFFMKKRIHFLDITGKVYGNATAPSVLIAYGKQNNDILSEYPLQGKYVNLEPNLFMIILDHTPKTWRVIVGEALEKLDGNATLQDIYECVIRIAPKKVSRNQHFKAKIRQTINYYFK